MGGKQEQKQKQEEKFEVKLGNKEVSDAESNMFRMQEFGGQAEADALIKHYKSEITLSEEDERILRENVPEPPKFRVLSREEYQRKNSCSQKSYRNKVKGYFEKRRDYYKKKSKDENKPLKGEKYASKLAAIQLRYDRMQSAKQLVKEEQEELEKYRKKGFYPDIEELAEDSGSDLTEVMDEQYKKMEEDPEYRQAEEDIGSMNYTILKKSGNFESGIKQWVGQQCQRYKKDMHAGHYMPFFKESKKIMDQHPLTRDLVVRRGNKVFSALALALGLKETATPEEIKERLKSRMDNEGEVVLKETAMMSTALPFAENKYAAGDNGSIGIEYIILAKKGTSAANVVDGATFKKEREVTFAQNTKFRIIKAQLDGDADILYGNKKSWKIYMVSVPNNQDGIKEEEGND